MESMGFRRFGNFDSAHKKYLRIGISSKKAKWIAVITCLAVAVGGVTGYDYYLRQQAETETITVDIPNVVGGRVTHGKNSAQKIGQIATDDKLTYESKEIETGYRTANAAVLSWSQTQNVSLDNAGEDNETHNESVRPQFRTFNGREWSDWVDAGSQEDRKDGTAAQNDALVLSDKINKIQYRFNLTAPEGGVSETINLSETKIKVIDTSKGPSPEKPKSLLDKITKSIQSSVHAKAEGPQVFSRADWGSPEPNSSTRWEPEYEPLSQAVVHHTATTQTPDTAAAIRAIWEFHANGRGWGDIGYNYIVDHGGNIFQGRYSNWADEQSQNGEVVGGHAYGNNYGTVGIAVLGNFTNSNPDNRSMQSVGKIAAWKLHRFNVNPAGNGPRGPNIVGHRDVTSTSCPGQRLYDNLLTIRYAGLQNFNSYASMAQYDMWYRGQGVNEVATNEVSLYPGDEAQVFVDITNTGNESWKSTGPNPTRLGTDYPRDHISPFVAHTWIAANRPASFQNKVSTPGDPNSTLTPTETIAPGETARFIFNIKAPAYYGQHRAYYQLVTEGRTWFLRQLGIHFIVNVNHPQYSWQFVSQGAYTDSSKTVPVDTAKISRGQRFYTELVVKNVGNKTWYRTGEVFPVKLATNVPHNRTSIFYDSSWNSINRLAVQKEDSVAPGQNATYGVWFSVPTTAAPGTYKEYVKLVADGYAWLNELGAHWLLTITN